MEFDFRSIVTFKPSSSTRTFSSWVPNRVSMLGVISILFFIQFWRIPPRAVAHCFSTAEIRCRSLRAGISRPVGKTRLFCVEVEPAEMLAPKGQATTINLSLPPPRGASQWRPLLTSAYSAYLCLPGLDRDRRWHGPRPRPLAQGFNLFGAGGGQRHGRSEGI